MRKAKQLWEAYRDNAHLQDIMETAVGSIIAAGGQALFTDMSPTEIAMSTAIGAGGAIALRPALARGGFALGRKIDKKLRPGFDEVLYKDPFLQQMLIGTPGHKRFMETQPHNEVTDVIRGISNAKYNQNYLRPDGTERGLAEGFIGSVGRAYGDNLAQGAVALTTPLLLEAMGGESRDDRKRRKLQEQLAALEN